jgi:hypothetical protein
MADASTQAQTYSNAGAAVAYNTSNYLKHVINQADVGRELILKLAGTNLTDANLESVTRYITTSHGVAGAGDSAFVVAAIGTADGSAFESGVTDTVFMRVQGTGDLTVGTADQGIGGLTITIEAIFTPAK